MTEAAVTVRLLGEVDLALLQGADPDVFDHAVEPDLAAAFLRDPRHHIAAAIDGDRLVGMASAVDYWHPDKTRELFVNEVGVASDYRCRGIGTRLMRALLDHARALGCRNAWVMTDADNAAAHRLYARAAAAERQTGLVMFTYGLDAA